METTRKSSGSLSRRMVAAGVFLGAGTGAALLPTRSALAAGAIGGKTVYASDFGVIADGITNDASALNSAVATMTNGSMLILPAGTIALGSSGWAGISIANLNDIRIQGNATIIKWLAAPSQSTGPSYPTGLRLTNCVRAVVTDITFDGNNIACAAIGLNACSSSVVYGCNAFSHAGTCQFASATGSKNTWERCRAWSSVAGGGTRGFWLGNSNVGYAEADLTVRSCSAEANSGTGFVFEGVRVLCASNRAINNGGAGIISPTAAGSPAEDHTIIGNIACGNAFHGYQVDAYGPNAQRIAIIANQFFNNANCGIYCAKGSQMVISENVLRNNAGAYALLVHMSSDIVISHNYIEGNASNSSCISTLQSPNTCSNISIIGNRCAASGTTLPAIYIYSGDSSCTIERVTVSDNVVSGGSHGVYIRAASAGAVLRDVTVTGNIASSSVSTGFNFQDATAGQTANLRAVANDGSGSVGSNVRMRANSGNSWNSTIGSGSSAPASGSWAVGDIIYNSAPAAAGYIGWVCTSAGTPGTWKTFGPISS